MKEFNVFTAIMNAVTVDKGNWAARELGPLLEWREEFQPKVYRFVLENLFREQTDETRVRILFLLKFLDGSSAYGCDVKTMKDTAEAILEGKLLRCSTDTDGCFICVCQDLRLGWEKTEELKGKFFSNWDEFQEKRNKRYGQV